MVSLETDRLLLRPWKLEDIDDFFEYAKDPNVGPNAGWPPHESKEVSAKILDSFISREEVWAIVYKENGKVIGSLGVHDDGKRNNTNSKMIGYVLSKDYWGHGLMTEAANRALEYLFNDKKLDIVSCYHYSFNLRSKSVIEKCGFKFEGIIRQASKIFNGNIYDEWCYSITAEEYKKIHN